MSSSIEAVIAYERERLARAGHHVTVTPVAELPAGGELGNDVIVGTLTGTAAGDGSLAGVALQSEGFTVGGAALARGALVVLRRRWFLDAARFSTLTLTDAVRLHPYVGPGREDKNGKQ